MHDVSPLIVGLPHELVKGLGDRWEAVPELLDGRAFTPEYVAPLLLVDPERDKLDMSRRLLRSRIAAVINSDYFRSFATEFDAGIVTDLIYLQGQRESLNEHLNLPYQSLVVALQAINQYRRLATADPEEVLELRDNPMVASAILRVLESHARPPLTGQLFLPRSNLDPFLEVLRTTPAGRKSANNFAKRARALLEAMFPQSLGPAAEEVEINEGRKRIDVVFPNMANHGAFAWAHLRVGAPFVLVECKNYSDDPANPEFDQLLGRFSRTRGSFGILLCRSIRNKELALKRCIDAARDQDRLVVPLDDEDLAVLADFPYDPGNAPLGSNLLTERMLRVLRG